MINIRDRRIAQYMQITVIYHKKIMNDKTLWWIHVDRVVFIQEKHARKFNICSWFKIKLSKLTAERIYFNTIKVICCKLIANTILNGQDMNRVPLCFGIRKQWSVLPLLSTDLKSKSHKTAKKKRKLKRNNIKWCSLETTRLHYIYI